MPSSHHTYITDVITEVRKLQPKSVLDIGVGFGKWGVLFREYLDVMPGRPFKKDWKIQIDGIEIFDEYIMMHQLGIYDKIHRGNCAELIGTIGNYDLMFMSDVLEHLEKDTALKFMDAALAKCSHFILNLPMGKVWLNSQGTVYGNKHEAHISSWEHDEICKYQVLDAGAYDCKGRAINMYVIKGAL